ncbi:MULTISPECIES: hypothetical protein [Sphingobacterium]|uniref:hypothetical protein n=1 Tax=Sphingobacterium TaxID=28453 RepID=UPI0013DAE3BC|nr:MULTISPECIES: hypothetical protein [unclassified Sphingobacterium]
MNILLYLLQSFLPEFFLIGHYSSGLKKPRQPQLKKMEERHHHLTAELQAVELV